MPNIKLVNIRFRLDGDERDKEIHDALFQYPDGARNNVMKDALYAYLIEGVAGNFEQMSQAPGSQVSKPVRRVLVSREVGAGMKEHDVVSQCPPVKVEESAVSAEQLESDEIMSPTTEIRSSGIREEQQVMAGLRSMIRNSLAVFRKKSAPFRASCRSEAVMPLLYSPTTFFST